MTRQFLAFWSLLALLICAGPVLADNAPPDMASLVADSLTIQSGDVLVAQGHVEVFYKTAHLTAEQVTYDRRKDQLHITGPIWLQDGNGNLIQAQMADLSADLTEGLLTAARLVLAQKLQLTAAELRRTGRYEVLRGVAASSCTICRGQTVPIWEIRAKSVVHDTLEHQIWFTGAELRFGGVPVLYLPELRVPDPSLQRATGFLLPTLRTTTRLGTGLKFPYFLTLGDSRDLTLTPYLTTKGDQTLDLRYRQAFRTGQVTLLGAVSQDTLLGPSLRGYAQMDGTFDLPRDYTLDFHLIGVTDPAYLLDYGISDDDRLNSTVAITRTQRNDWTSAAVTGIQSLRADESTGASPSFLTDFDLHRRFTPAILGGTGGFELQAHSTFRESSSPLDSNGDGIADGRDLARLSARLDWRRNWLLTPGIEVTAIGQLVADDYQIGQDADFAGNQLRAAGIAGVELRWPWTRSGAQATQTIEPVLQIVTSPQTQAHIPNEDSALVEFDEGNLFSLDRFPGADAVETGLRANLGVSYDLILAGGLDLGVTAGRVIRLDPPLGFPGASGLDSAASDWLVAWNVSGGDLGLQLTNRLILDNAFALTKGELRLDLARAKYDLAAGYSYVQASTQEDRPDPISELTLDGGYNITDQWRLNSTGRYNVAQKQLAEAGMKVTFRNECLNVDLSLSRRFTTSTTVKPSTDFGLSVELLGFGGSGLSGMARQCRQ